MGSFSLLKPWEPITKTLEYWDGNRIESGNYFQRISPEKSAVLFLNTRFGEQSSGSIITLDFKTESVKRLDEIDSFTGLWSAFQTWRLYDDLINRITIRRVKKIFRDNFAKFPYVIHFKKKRMLENQFSTLLGNAMENYKKLLGTFSEGDQMSFPCLWDKHCKTFLTDEIEETGIHFKDKRTRAQIQLYIDARLCLNRGLKNGNASREQMIYYLGSENPTLAYEHSLNHELENKVIVENKGWISLF